MNAVQRAVSAEGHTAAPLRLGYLIDSLVTGGAERLVVTFAEALKTHPEARLTVFVLSDKPTQFRDALVRTGVEVVPLPGRSLVDPLRMIRLIAALRARRIEYLHAHLTSSTVIGGFASWLLGIPFAVTVHNVKPSVKQVSSVRQKLYRAALGRGAVRRIAVGEAVALAAAADAGGRPFALVPNAVAADALGDPARRPETRASLGLAPETLALLAVGSLIPQKGYPDLLDAFAGSGLAAEGARLLIAGHDAGRGLRAALETQAQALGIADHVTFLGMRRDIPDLLAAADVFVSASHWEGAPVSLLEALANGLPCVVTDVGDNALVLADTPALLAPPGDPAAFAAALRAMAADPDRRAASAEAGRRRGLGDYGAEAWVQRLFDLYAGQTPRKDWRGPLLEKVL